jgi:hypothetical protein
MTYELDQPAVFVEDADKWQQARFDLARRSAAHPGEWIFLDQRADIRISESVEKPHNSP